MQTLITHHKKPPYYRPYDPNNSFTAKSFCQRLYDGGIVMFFLLTAFGSLKHLCMLLFLGGY